MAEYIFKAFNPEEDIISGKTKVKTYPIWSDRPDDVDTNPESILGTIDNPMFTSSDDKTLWESNYYYNVYNDNPDTNKNAAPQLSFAFATTSSIQVILPSPYNLNGELQYTYPSKAIYSQFLSVLEEKSISNPDGLFKIQVAPNVDSYTDIKAAYIISIARDRIKDGIEVNSWQLNLSGSGGASGSLLKLISPTGSNYLAKGINKVPIIIGSLSDNNLPNQLTSSYGTEMGIFYPKHGVFVLDAIKIHNFIGSTISGYNPNTIATASSYIPSSSLLNFWNLLKSGSYFRAKTTENVKTTHYFCRIKNFEFNHSTNPTWVSGSSNEVLDSFYGDPKTFITTVGLYDGDADSGQLVAVAKLSRPIPKDQESEVLIKVMLSF